MAGESYKDNPEQPASVAALRADFSTHASGAPSLHTQPNSWNHSLSDHAVIFSRPLPPSLPKRPLWRTTVASPQDAGSRARITILGQPDRGSGTGPTKQDFDSTTREVGATRRAEVP